MTRIWWRWAAILIGAAGLTGSVGLAGVQQPDARTSSRTLTAAAAPADNVDQRPERIHLRPPVAATPSSQPTSAPGRHVALRPIPVPAIQAQEVALFNLDTGRFMWLSNARQAWAPASLTKIFTAMVASDLMPMDALATVPASISALPPDSTVMGLTPGEQVTVRDLMYGVFLNSGNDAAETLAVAVTARSAFIADMNAKASRLGLRTTHFVNPTGLDAAGHYSSADDLTVAAAYLESHYPGLVSIAATPAIKIPATATHKAFALVSLDKLLWTYPGTYGLKTGWTDAAGGCLITTSDRGGHRLLAVLLGAPAGTAYEQMPRVLDYGFELLGVLPRPAA